jgi:hypothetical protein
LAAHEFAGTGSAPGKLGGLGATDMFAAGGGFCTCWNAGRWIRELLETIFPFFVPKIGLGEGFLVAVGVALASNKKSDLSEKRVSRISRFFRFSKKIQTKFQKNSLI